MADKRKEETKLQAAIVTGLEQLGYHVERIQSGIHQVNRGWLHCASVGTPDLVVVKDPVVFLEVKLPKQTCEVEQLSWHCRARDAGVRVVVVRSVGEAVEAVRNAG